MLTIGVLYDTVHMTKGVMSRQCILQKEFLLDNAYYTTKFLLYNAVLYETMHITKGDFLLDNAYCNSSYVGVLY